MYLQASLMTLRVHSTPAKFLHIFNVVKHTEIRRTCCLGSIHRSGPVDLKINIVDNERDSMPGSPNVRQRRRPSSMVMLASTTTHHHVGQAGHPYEFIF